MLLIWKVQRRQACAFVTWPYDPLCLNGLSHCAGVKQIHLSAFWSVGKRLVSTHCCGILVYQKFVIESCDMHWSYGFSPGTGKCFVVARFRYCGFRLYIHVCHFVTNFSWKMVLHLCISCPSSCACSEYHYGLPVLFSLQGHWTKFLPSRFSTRLKAWVLKSVDATFI